MKVLKATCFVLCQLHFYTTILTVTVPSLLQHHPFPTLNTTTPTTLARPSALIDYPITGTPTGSVYFYSYGSPLNATDTNNVLRDARIEIYDHVRIDLDAVVGRLLKIYIRGNVEHVLAPKRGLTWEIWSAAFDAVRMFYVALDVAMIFEVVDDKFGYVGGGWMTLLLG